MVSALAILARGPHSWQRPRSYWTVSDSVKDFAKFTALVTMICTVDVPAGVTGVLGGVGVVGGVEVAAELPPHPVMTPVPASRAINRTSKKPREESLRLLPAKANDPEPKMPLPAAGKCFPPVSHSTVRVLQCHPQFVW